MLEFTHFIQLWMWKEKSACSKSPRLASVGKGMEPWKNLFLLWLLNHKAATWRGYTLTPRGAAAGQVLQPFCTFSAHCTTRTSLPKIVTVCKPFLPCPGQLPTSDLEKMFLGLAVAMNHRTSVAGEAAAGLQGGTGIQALLGGAGRERTRSGGAGEAAGGKLTRHLCSGPSPPCLHILNINYMEIKRGKK